MLQPASVRNVFRIKTVGFQSQVMRQLLVP